jgi:hypothetical protein
MSDRRDHHGGGDSDGAPSRGPTHGPPRRIVLVAGIVLVVALLGAIIYLHLGGAIGPGTH